MTPISVIWWKNRPDLTPKSNSTESKKGVNISTNFFGPNVNLKVNVIGAPVSH